MADIYSEAYIEDQRITSGTTYVADLSAAEYTTGDLLVVLVETEINLVDSVSGNNGGTWTKGTGANCFNYVSFFYSQVGATPDTTLTLTFNGSPFNFQIAILVIKDFDATTPVVTEGFTYATTISPVMPQLSLSTNTDSLLVGVTVTAFSSIQVLPPPECRILKSMALGSTSSLVFTKQDVSGGTTSADPCYSNHNDTWPIGVYLIAIKDGGSANKAGHIDPDSTPINYISVMGNAGYSGHLSVDNVNYDPTDAGGAFENISTLDNDATGYTTTDVVTRGLASQGNLLNGYTSCGQFIDNSTQRDDLNLRGVTITETYASVDNYDLSSATLIVTNIAAGAQFLGKNQIGCCIGLSDKTNARFWQLPTIDATPSSLDGRFPTVIDLSSTAYVMDEIGTPNMNNVGAILLGIEATQEQFYITYSPITTMGVIPIVGGFSGTPSTMEAARQWSKSLIFTILAQGGLTEDQYFIAHNTQVGGGGYSGTKTVFSCSGQSFVFPDDQSRLNFKFGSAFLTHTIRLANAGDSVDYSGSSWNFGNFHNFVIHASTNTGATYTFNGCNILSATPTLNAVGSAITGLTLTDCKEITYTTLLDMSGGCSFVGCIGTQQITVTSKADFEKLQNCEFSNCSALAIKITGNQTGTWSGAGMTVSGGGGSYDIEYTGTTDFTIEFDVGSGFVQGRVDNSAAVTAGNTGLTVSTPTQALRINPDVNITGSIRYFDGTPDDQTPNGSGTGDFLDYTYSTTDPIDIEVVEQGYVPVNQQNVTPFDGTLTIEMDIDEAYNASHSLTIVTHYTYNRATKALNILADQNAFDVRSSMADTIRTNSSYYNTPLLLEAKPGGKRIDLIDGATITSMATWKGAGMERYDAADAINPVEKWYAIQSVNNIAGSAVVYRQTNSGDFTVGSLTNNVFDETLQFYSDPDHDGTPATENNSYLLIKALRVGYRQARNDVVAGNGGASLKADLYTIGLSPTAHDYAGGPIDLSATMTLVAGGTVGGKIFSYKWVDAGTNSGTDIADWINYMGATSPNGIIPGGTGLRWAEMPDMVIYVTGGVETAQGYKEGATPTLVGFYMERGGADHPDMVRAQADDGAYYTPAQSATVTINNITTTSRVQLYDTANSVELYNDVPGSTSYQYSETYSIDRTVRVRITDVVGATAKEMIEATVGSISTSSYDISYTASQVDDDTYNTNAIDGSTVSNIAIDDSTNLVNINISAGAVTWPQIYAYQVYWLNTATGIQDDFAFIEAPDTANYILTSFKIKNVTSPSVPLVISSGYGRDSTTGASVDLVDTTGGTLIFAPDHVVAYSSGSGLTAGQDANLTAIKAKTDSLTFTAGLVDSNCESMNGHALTGDGSESDKIRTVNAP